MAKAKAFPDCIYSFFPTLPVKGINGSCESDYVRSFCSKVNKQGYRAAVLNHMGALKNVSITGNRIFTYGMLF